LRLKKTSREEESRYTNNLAATNDRAGHDVDDAAPNGLPTAIEIPKNYEPEATREFSLIHSQIENPLPIWDDLARIVEIDGDVSARELNNASAD
jgi:hypothetical protein